VVAGKEKHNIPEDELRTLYQSMTMAQLAEYYGCGESTVWLRLKKYGIKHDAYGDLGHRHRPREFTEQHRKRMSEARKGRFTGANGTNWKGGVTFTHLKLRNSPEYRAWRVAALNLRGNKCQGCGKEDGAECKCCGTQVKLHVHHLHSFAGVPEKRFDPENSEVLCPKCHYSRHKRKTG
jgi:5-methylcytosine-specific restriction endonuclease McrA